MSVAAELVRQGHDIGCLCHSHNIRPSFIIAPRLNSGLAAYSLLFDGFSYSITSSRSKSLLTGFSK